MCSQLNGSLLEDYFKTAKRGRYNLMCSIEAHERNHKLVNYDASSGGGIPLPSNSIEEALISFSLTLNCI